ncbi:MAG: hypothetical protein R3C01_11205 [Planctomycetaceae bacterium]
MKALSTLALLCSLLAVGCGGAPERPSVAKVTGTITRGGTPVAHADVVFHPQGTGDIGKAASGKTDATGKFELSTFDANDGAVVGKHKVTIVAGTASTDIPSDPEGMKQLEEERK